ncbi:MAG: TolC family protein, partial [Thermoanaerobaculia bacterium]
PVPAQDTLIESSQQFVFVGQALVSQPLSQQFKIGLGVRARKLGEEIAQERLRGERQSVAGQVRETYYALLRGESTLEAAREGLAAAREIERVFGERLETGAVLEADLLETKARRARAEYEELAAGNALDALKEQMNRLLARPIGTDFRVASVPGPTLSEADLEAARHRALERQPRLRAARLQVSQADYDWKLQKAQWIPDLSLALLYIRTENFDSFIPKQFFGFGLLLQWEVFDGGRRSRLEAVKEKTLRQAANAATESEAAALVEVGRIHRQLEEALRYVEAAEAGRAAARERLRISRDRYAAEAAPAAELLEAQARQSDADRRYQEAVATFWAARAAYDRAVGEEP